MPAPDDPLTFALALLSLDGVGRVTTRRLLDQFDGYEDLRRYPREQIRTRLRGVPGADRLVERLLDRTAMEEALSDARKTLEALQARRLTLLAPPSPGWPDGIDDLEGSDRPVLLYAYGHTAILQQPRVALLARPPLSEAAFETAQALVRHLLAAGVVPVTGTQTGFDVVIHKLSTLHDPPRPTLMVAPCGLARIVPSNRPMVSAAVRAGGLCLSSFPLHHGPFSHDDRERALLQAALAHAAVFVEPTADTPEAAALDWAHAHHRPVFGISASPPDDDRLHPLREPIDFDWVLAAVRHRS
ncbi:hypothetical protein AWN76_003605 [Rhodothermaceae bacterium RA]|nr:hypothetical protein AWN76_003605 [Rhodothermaceae bacterium RA]